jgi:hypothetical protein
MELEVPELLGSTKCVELLDGLDNYLLLKKVSAPWI